MHQIINRKIHGKEQNIVGIVGKNGKSTIAQILHHCYTELGISNKMESAAEFFDESYENPEKDVIIEVSLCAIKEKLVSYIDFDSLIFTNTGKDASLDELWTIKRPFIALSLEKTAIVNIDDELGAEVCDLTIASTITYAINKPADINARNIKLAIDKTEFDLYYKGSFVCRVETPYFGIYNIYNTLTVVAQLISMDCNPEKIALLLVDLPQIEGRFDSFVTKSEIRVIVDYARTSEAIGAVLKSLATVCPGNIITVTGADANTNAAERTAIGKNALMYSKQVIFTTDNARKEDAQSIIYDIIKGNVRQNYRICIDREKAIDVALNLAKPKDVVILLGKGHEKIQIIGEATRFFCDKKTALYLVEKYEI